VNATAAAARRRHELRVAHRARGIDLEEITAAPIVQPIEHPHEPVVRAEPAVPHHLVAEHPAGIRVEELGADIEVVLAEENPDLGALRFTLAVSWLRLCKVPDRRRPLPGGFVQDAVHRNAFAGVQTQGDGRRLFGRRRRRRGGRGRLGRRDLRPDAEAHQAGKHMKMAGHCR